MIRNPVTWWRSDEVTAKGLESAVPVRCLILPLLLALCSVAQGADVKTIEQIDKQFEARNYGAAEELAKKLLADTVAKRGENHDDTIQALQQVSFVLEGQKKYAESEPLRRRARQDRKRNDVDGKPGDLYRAPLFLGAVRARRRLN